ncbi:hypothetical protein FrCorBMG51_13685 [Protofrankia coriariae]|uniref:Immunity protein 35 n=1 Tax=Protofrankia coriariae TaxID=1562887 RepID=A0ABR5F311_9ACTN|nr:hypothetical protein FrCorBMG51_13685 [Protofrankia coriariae]
MECFANYLRDLTGKRSVDELLVALDTNGLYLERDLLQARRDGLARRLPAPESAGIWSGRRCWLGWYPPDTSEASAGDLWFDPVEISLMVLIPQTQEDLAELAALPPRFLARQTPFVGWVSVRQMAVWQAMGCSLVAGRDLLVDTDAGPPHAAVAGVPPALAWDIALFLGKATCDPDYWEAAHEALSAEELTDMWPDDAPEHAGEVNSGFWIVVGRDDVLAGTPWDNDLGDSFPYLHASYPAPGVRFRTAVSSQLGIINPNDESKSWTAIGRRRAAMAGNE